jgi:hypothetical protein
MPEIKLVSQSRIDPTLCGFFTSVQNLPVVENRRTCLRYISPAAKQFVNQIFIICKQAHHHVIMYQKQRKHETTQPDNNTVTQKAVHTITPHPPPAAADSTP